MGSEVVGALLTSNPTNAREAGLVIDDEQRVWFGGGVKDLVLVSCQDPFYEILCWESLLTKMDKKLVGSI